MGWNDSNSLNDDPLLRGLKIEDNVYYVHSYYAEVNGFTTAVCDYGLPFSAAMRRDNFFATQFHPRNQLRQEPDLQNFLEL